jgi:hypothetical protein
LVASVTARREGIIGRLLDASPTSTAVALAMSEDPVAAVACAGTWHGEFVSSQYRVQKRRPSASSDFE